jgi:hypothetical protein
MPRVAFKFTIPVFEWLITGDTLDHVAILIRCSRNSGLIIPLVLNLLQTSGSQPLRDRGPVNSSIRGGPGTEQRPGG